MVSPQLPRRQMDVACVKRRRAREGKEPRAGGEGAARAGEGAAGGKGAARWRERGPREEKASRAEDKGHPCSSQLIERGKRKWWLEHLSHSRPFCSADLLLLQSCCDFTAPTDLHLRPPLRQPPLSCCDSVSPSSA
jgi:hypothetical protein